MGFKPCIVASCRNKGSHRFPMNEERRKKWVNAIKHIKPGYSVKKYTLICSAHFQPADFARTPSSYYIPADIAPKVLKKTAVPSMFPWKRTGTSDDIEQQLLMLPSTLSMRNVDQISSAPSTSCNENVDAAFADDLLPTFDPNYALNTYSRAPPLVFVEVEVFEQQKKLKLSTDDTNVEYKAHECSVIEIEISSDISHSEDAQEYYTNRESSTQTDECNQNKDILQRDPFKLWYDKDSNIENKDHEQSVIKMEIGDKTFHSNDVREDYTKRESSTQTDVYNQNKDSVHQDPIKLRDDDGNVENKNLEGSVIEIEIIGISHCEDEQGNYIKQESSTQTDGYSQDGFSVINYKFNDAAIHFYTGLESFKKFMQVFRTLGNSTNNLKYLYGLPPKKLDMLDCFFIVLIILRRHKSIKELSMLYQIPVKQVYNIFVTWIQFMSLRWKNLDLWVDLDTVKSLGAK